MAYGFTKLLITVFASGPGLISLFSLLSLILISFARKKLPEGKIKSMVENLVALAFVTYLFTFFHILIRKNFIKIDEIIGEFILNIFIVLILIVIIKITVDIIKYSKEKSPKKRKTTSKSKKTTKKKR